VSGSASSATATITKLEILDNGNSVTEVAASSISTSRSFGPGSHSVSLRATDSNGMITTSGASNITVRAVGAPLFSFQSPSDNSTYIVGPSGLAAVPVYGFAGSSWGSITSIEVLDGGSVLKSFVGGNVDTTVALAPGVHGLQLRATNNFNVTTTSEVVTVTVPQPPLPSVTKTAPANPTNVNVQAGSTTMVSVSGSASVTGGSITQIEVLDGTTVLKTVPASSISTTVLLGAASHSISLRATSSFGTVASSSASTVNVTAVGAPSVSMTAPTNPASFTVPAGSTTSVSVSGSASSTNGSISKLEVLDGSVAIATVYSGSINTTVPLGGGGHSISLRATNNVDGVGNSAAVTITVTEIGAPSVSMTAPTSPASFSIPAGSTASISVSGSASSANGSITKLEVLDGSVPIKTVNTGSISTTVPLGGGSHSISLRATNSVSVVGNSAAVAITVTEVGAPSVSMTAPANPTNLSVSMGASANVSVSGSASSANGSITQLAVLDGGVAIATFSSASINTTVPLAAGNHSISLRATNSVGVTGNSGASTVNVVYNVPTISIARTPSTLAAGESFNITWSTSDATSVSYSCTSGSPDFSTSRTGLPANNSNVTGTAAAAWVATAPVCNWTAIGPGGSKPSTDTMTTVAWPRDAAFVSQSVPATMAAGKSYSVSVTMRNSGNTAWTVAEAYKLGAQNPQDNQNWVMSRRVALDSTVNPGEQKTFAFTVNAPTVPGTYNFQWQMLREPGLWFGAQSTSVPVNVTASSNTSLKAVLAASPSNVRVAGASTAAVTLSGSGTHSAGLLARIELYKDSGSGYGSTPETTVSASAGGGASLSLTPTVNLSAGVYRFKLRSIDTSGNIVDSAATAVNVTNSSLLGIVNGVRLDASNVPQLTGWACQDASTEALSVSVFINAPSTAMGGTQVYSGAANLSTDPENATVQATCHTGSASHHFNVDLNALSAAVQGGIPVGMPLFVQAKTSGGASIVLPCGDTNCTMPGSLRIGLTTPVNGDRYQAPATVFMRAKLTNGAGPFDEIAFSINGEWITGQADSATNTYYASKSGVSANASPYRVIAKVRQGNSTLYSVVNLISVGGAGSSSIALNSPTPGSMLAIGLPIALSATPAGATASVTSVNFYSGTMLIGTGTNANGVWSAVWAGAQAGTYSINAQSNDVNGVLLAQSASVSMTVSGSSSASSAAPLPVTTSPPHLGNADAGTLPGGLSVANSGAANYSIPIAVPPGAAGLAPKLSLDYNSQGTNGLVGSGWSLSARSSIHRCGKTIAQDGVNDRIRFANSDRLCSDGQRLILKGHAANDAAYWADGAEFRTEIDSFSRITAFGPIANRTYKVESKDGQIATYGGITSTVKAVVGTVNSGVTAPQPQPKSGPLSWAVERVQDRAGNYINFAYTQDIANGTGEHLLSAIRYGANGVAAHAAVLFTYESRPDAWKKYVDETRNDMRYRLSHIKTYVGSNLNGDVTAGTWVKDYTLSYEQSPTSGRSLLASVQACGRNPGSGATECLPATTFSWGKPDPSKSAGFVNRGLWSGAPILTTWRIKPEGLATRYNSMIRTDFFAFADFENHGRTDVLEKRVATFKDDRANSVPEGTMNSQYRYFHNSGSGFTTYNYRLNTGEYFSVLGIGDVNGDGAPDLIVSTVSNGPKVCLSPLSRPAGLPAVGNAIVFTCDPSLKALGGLTDKSSPYVVDVLGDGRVAQYGRVAPADGKAMLCIQGACVSDPNPPASIIGYQYNYVEDYKEEPKQFFIGFEQSIDFAGTGKHSEVRWTRPYFLGTLFDGEGPVHFNKWVNTQAEISVTGFLAPGSVGEAGSLASYKYPDYKPTCQGVTQKPYDFERPSNIAALSADFNGSGYSSLMFGYKQYAYDDATCAHSMPRAEINVCLSTGRALDCGVRQKYSGANYRAVRAVGNFVGDGAPAVLVETLRTPLPPVTVDPDPIDPGPLSPGDPNNPTRGGPTSFSKARAAKSATSGLTAASADSSIPEPSGSAELCRIVGDDTTYGTGTNDTNMVCEPLSGIALPKLQVIPQSTAQESVDRQATDQMYLMDLLGTGREQLMIYHSGAFDANHNWQEDGRWELFEPVDRAKPGQALDRIYQVSNGVGQVSSVEYADGVASGIVSQTGANALTYPQRPSAGIGKLVSKLHIGNGVAGTRTTSYRYFDAANDVAGRGSLGFAKVESTDVDTGIVASNTYAQVWPFTGMLQSSTVTGGGCGLSNTQNRLASKTTAGGTSFAYVAGGTATYRDLYGCQQTKTVTVSGVGGADVQYDGNGNLLNSQMVTAGGGNSFTEQTVKTYYATDTANWLIGLVQKASVTRSQSSDGKALTRAMSYTYDSAGRVATETVMPDDASVTMKVITSYDRSNNAFGLAGKKTQQWTDPLTGQAVIRFDTTLYDASGRYPATVTNAASHGETRAYDPGSGSLLSLTGPNALATSWSVDAFGRVTRELRADLNETRQYRKQCDGQCPPGAAVAAVTENFHGANRISVPIISYADNAGQALRTQTWGFDGRVIVADSRYDALGRLWEADQPHYSGDAARLAKRQTYDILNRVRSVVAPDENGSEHASTTDYQGLVTVNTNAKGQTRTDTRDALGQVVQVLDAKAGVTVFAYDPFGNLSQTTDANGNVIKVSYDDLGRRTQLKDSDLGQIDYTVDAAGRTRRQVNPVQRFRGQSAEMQFDNLDRITARMEPELESHWLFDTAVMGVGQLAEAYTGTPAAKDHRRTHIYDSLGRPSTTTQILFDAAYTSTPTYDAWSREVTRTLRRGSDAPKVFDTRYNDRGHVVRVERGGLVLWLAQTQDASHRVTMAKLGNTLTQTYTYSEYTGRIQEGMLQRRVMPVKMPLLEAYDYDALGNVLQRSMYWETQSFSENFHYDELNRLDWSEVSGQPRQNFAYDSAGSLTSKTGVGTGNYVYPGQGPTAIRPHAIQSIPGIGAFAYDDNGNLTSGAGRTATWTTFDMPIKITKGPQSSNFVYGPEHQRTRQTKQDGSNIVYAGGQEVELNSSNQPTSIKTYWPHGLGVEIDKPSAATELNWVHHDRLGSAVAITDGGGNLKEKLAYDAWGKRRSLDGALLNGTPTPDSLDGVVDNKGFTGHEMLDQLDLVHMNGRIYEPFVGRFMSGDPLIQDPVNGQNYNRYSYVLNNPTNLTDPTGFACKKDAASNMPSADCKDDRDGPRRSEDAEASAGRRRQSLERQIAYDRKTDSNLIEKSDAKNGASQSANRGPTIMQTTSNFFGQAMRSFGIFDSFVPSRESFESGAQQVLGGPCEYSCTGHDAAVRSTADVMQGAAQGVAEAGNRYYPEVARNALLTALPEMALAKTAVAPVEKFADYIFKEGATHGKDAVFRSLGYNKSHSAELAAVWSRQAAEKYANGQYTLGKLNEWGQRVDIGIDLRGIQGSNGKISHITSGWMIQPNGSIILNTPFSGFAK
jgi:RHS repeat-associated protein